MIEVVSIAGVATVQDGGRPGFMHEGLPPGGALIPESLARANWTAGNAAAEAAIELMGTLTLTARSAVTMGTDEGQRRTIDEGESWTIAGRGGLVHYVAARGGIDVPWVLGGRGTLLVANLGGHEGRPLRRGDTLRVGSATSPALAGANLGPAREEPLPPAVDRLSPIHVVLGPDLDRFDARAVEVLLSSTFVVDGRSDRVGTRLSGPKVGPTKDAIAVSAPMLRGAIQVPPSGELIVLGPDHPTTGGYPVIATVTRSHLGSIAARAAGASVRFVAC